MMGTEPTRLRVATLNCRDAGWTADRRVPGIDLALPGHEEPIEHLYKRITEIGEFHRARLERVLEGVGTKRVRFAFFVTEEPPYFRTEAMGSLQYARALARRNERVIAMYSLETIGFYSSAPGSQIYPAPFGLMFPDRGDFVAFVGMLGSRALVRKTIRSFRSHTAFPSIGGVAPGFVPGIGWSDHWAFAEHGFEAVMITDTAPFRYPHYHRPSDTPDKIDAEKVARVVKGIERVIRDLGNEQ